MRILLTLLAVVIVVLIARRLLAPPRPVRRPPAAPGNMVRCNRCGMYIPESEALGQRGRHYCSAEHRDADRD